MFRTPLWKEALPVMITIRVEGSRSLPSGDVMVDEAAPMPFTGWLQLLGILSAAIPDEGDSGGLAQHLGGQFDARVHAELGEDV
jgi:hypothetical protein